MSAQSSSNSRLRVRALLLGTSAMVAMFAASTAAHAQANLQTLDPITVLATKTEEKASESLSAVSTVRQETLQQLMPSKVSDAFMGIPGVWFQERADDPGSAINIRGLQDFGRVAIVIDGARQNFQRTGHNADGVFYLEPELIGGADVVRGPSANVYGSGAIGGVVSFRTKDVDDVLKPGQRWGILTHGELGSNQSQGLGSIFAATRINPNAEVMFGGTTRSKSNYKDASGAEIPNSGYDVWTGIAKVTVRPADGHEVKFGYTHYDSDYTTGQPNPPTNTASQYGTGVQNDIANLRYTYSKPDDRLFDFDANVYWTQTITDQTKTAGTGSVIAGFIGDSRKFSLQTVGFDVHNTSRFDTGPVRHALTYGVDGFQDEVTTSGFGVIFTPSGKRTVSGGFVQLKSNYGSWVEVISAARYDRYELDPTATSKGVSGDRVSPKFTVGLTPLKGITPYVTYAEGYRAPSTTETLIAGVHPVAGASFEFLPNPGLRPETGKTKEIGLNLKFDDIITKGDGFRGKVNVYRNDVDDYIEQVNLNIGQVGQGSVTCLTLTPGPVPDCIQYQNITKAVLKGTELEGTYDAGSWFLGLAASRVRGGNVATDAPLARIPPDQVTTTVGLRLLERKLTLALRWQAVADKQRQDIPPATGAPTFPPTEAYHLVNFHAGYQFNPDVLGTFSVENLLNEQYSRYMTYYPNPSSAPGALPLAFPAPGVTFKAGLQVRFGEDFFKYGSIL